MEGRKDEEMRQKRSSVVLELNGLAHTIKRYFAGISEKAAGGNQVWEGLSPANFGVIAFLWENRDRDIGEKGHCTKETGGSRRQAEKDYTVGGGTGQHTELDGGSRTDGTAGYEGLFRGGVG